MPFLIDVEALNLARAIGDDTRRGFAPVELNDADESCFVLADECRHHGVDDLRRLNRLGVVGLAVQVHVGGCVDCFERVSEGTLQQNRKRGGIAFVGVSNVGHGRLV